MSFLPIPRYCSRVVIISLFGKNLNFVDAFLAAWKLQTVIRTLLSFKINNPLVQFSDCHCRSQTRLL